MNKNIYWSVMIVVIMISCSSQKNTTITPSSNFPGELVTITNISALPASEEQRILFNGVPADIIPGDSNILQCLVPELPPGKVSVRILQQTKLIDTAIFTVLGHPSQELLFKVDKDDVILISKSFSNKNIPANNLASAGTVNYKYLSSNKQTIAAGDVQLEQGTMEVFPDSSGTITRRHTITSTFSILVPNRAGANEITFFKKDISKNPKMIATIGQIPWKTITIKN